jgi:RimJ/RimL family protein N-acetyltransferase
MNEPMLNIMNVTSLFPSTGIFAENDTLKLCRIKESEYEYYEKLERENAINPIMFDRFDVMSELWADFNKDTVLVCSIIRKSDNNFCGYCEIKNINDDPPEFGIEILKSYQNKGIGFTSLNLLMSEFTKKTGAKCYRSRVDSDNYASQRVMEKLGAVPNGISAFLLKTSEQQERFEQENLNLIDDKLREVACKFGVQPQKLLSHVLEYRIYAN